MSKPRVNTNPVANHYSAPGERIIEFTGQNGLGGLISIRNSDDGRMIVDVYRCDEGVIVMGQPSEWSKVQA